MHGRVRSGGGALCSAPHHAAGLWHSLQAAQHVSGTCAARHNTTRRPTPPAAHPPARQPLKFLRPHYETLKARHDALPAGAPNRTALADVVSALAMTSAAEGSRETLKYRLVGSKDDVGIWGHEYIRHLAGARGMLMHECTSDSGSVGEGCDRLLYACCVCGGCTWGSPSARCRGLAKGLALGLPVRLPGCGWLARTGAACTSRLRPLRLLAARRGESRQHCGVAVPADTRHAQATLVACMALALLLPWPPLTSPYPTHPYSYPSAGEIGEEFDERQGREETVEDLMALVGQIVPYHMTHNAGGCGMSDSNPHGSEGGGVFVWRCGTDAAALQRRTGTRLAPTCMAAEAMVGRAWPLAKPPSFCQPCSVDMPLAALRDCYPPTTHNPHAKLTCWPAHLSRPPAPTTLLHSNILLPTWPPPVTH